MGDLLSQVCQKAGLYVMAINDFESRIRGGHSFVQIRVSDHAVFSPRKDVHLLIALDLETVRRHQHRIPEGGLILSQNPFEEAEKLWCRWNLKPLRNRPAEKLQPIPWPQALSGALAPLIF
ncbi:MAG: 2-oxoacid:acceptor oxidoreductase family protein [Desulfobacterales bacterium]